MKKSIEEKMKLVPEHLKNDKKFLKILRYYINEIKTIDNAGNINCVDCSGCSYCVDCKDCQYCKDCVSCRRCNSCVDCKYSADCKKCKHCKYCFACNYCFTCLKSDNKYYESYLKYNGENQEYKEKQIKRETLLYIENHNIF